MKSYSHFIRTQLTASKLALVSGIALVTLTGCQGIQLTQQISSVQAGRRPLLTTCRVCQDELLGATQAPSTLTDASIAFAEPLVRPTGPR